MNKLVTIFITLAIGFSFSTTAIADEKILDEYQYFPSMGTGCSYKVYKDGSRLQIDVNCHPKGSGTCIGSDGTSGFFSCGSSSTSGQVHKRGISESINWIINSL